MFSIAVLAGGDSHERDVSLASGRCVAEALSRGGHWVEVFDPAVVDLPSIAWRRFDACFIALHGGAGEDGRVQRRLGLLKVPYTGSAPSASRLAMSKSAAKERFLQAGVATLPYVLFHRNDGVDDLATRVTRLGLPLAIKPDSQGSSLGVGRADALDELPARIAAASRFDEFLVAEPWVVGRELTVSVLGRKPLPIIEIDVRGGFFDYAAKYGGRDARRTFDLGLSADQHTAIAAEAVAAAESLGTAGLVRVDLVMDADQGTAVLEVNTVPGLTEHSLAPMAASQAGLDMTALCEWMIRDCLATGALR